MKLENNRVSHEELIEMAKQIHKGTERASNVVRGLEEFSRDGSQDPVQTQSIRIICEESLTIFNEKCSKFQIKIIKENLHPLYINCRALQIIQIIFHILNNSIFEVLKLKEKWIEFHSKEDSEFIYLRITDSGKGIAPSISKKIFDPFFSKKEGKNKGTGLGLSIAKVILHEHKGDIQYELYNGHTSFILKFPKVENQT
jgi:signal transduction histidine kinase